MRAAEIFLGALIATTFFVSEPVYLSEDAIARLREGRFWSKENRVAFAPRDLDEFTHTSAFRRALDLNNPPNPARQKFAKGGQRKRSARRK